MCVCAEGKGHVKTQQGGDHLQANERPQEKANLLTS